MLGENTLTLDFVGDGSDVVVLHNVQNGEPYTSEYRGRGTDREHIVLVRHSKEKNKTKGQQMDRHNVTYTVNIFPTDLYPQGQTFQVYSVIRNIPEFPLSEIDRLVGALVRVTLSAADELAIWKS